MKYKEISQTGQSVSTMFLMLWVILNIKNILINALKMTLCVNCMNLPDNLLQKKTFFDWKSNPVFSTTTECVPPIDVLFLLLKCHWTADPWFHVVVAKTWLTEIELNLTTVWFSLMKRTHFLSRQLTEIFPQRIQAKTDYKLKVMKEIGLPPYHRNPIGSKLAKSGNGFKLRWRPILIFSKMTGLKSSMPV